MLKQVLSKMSYFYGNSLQSTSSDIIAITDNQKRIKTTPFYVYFDPSLIHTKVYIFINGTDTGVHMTIGELGQCFFEYPEIESPENMINQAFTESSDEDDKGKSDEQVSEKNLNGPDIKENTNGLISTDNKTS
ncbi:hypothetical protein M153_16732000396, partial [Pseudoloma neurophilia]